MMGLTRLVAVFLPVVLTFSLLQTPPAFATKKSYVVYLGSHSHGPDATSADYDRATENHYNFLGSFLGSKEMAKEVIFYSYQKHINGFAAMLEEEEALAISKHPDVISVFLNKPLPLMTTHSWEFMGLERDGRIPKESIWTRANFGKDVIIAHLDTGVWPESESFNDEGMGPVPSRWKGSCQNNTKEGVPCNRKLIGARYFEKGYDKYHGHPPTEGAVLSPRDFDGHGTHTLSTAGGRFVVGANLFGHGNGTAKGGSPGARVATYKVCWSGGVCSNADTLAGLDAAISDGVDVLSISLGHQYFDYTEDVVAIGAFHALINGIAVVCAGGNYGPSYYSLSNIAPWLLTVAAASTDRVFSSTVKLGNNHEYQGESLSADRLPKKMYPLINAVNAGRSNATDSSAQKCDVGTLDPEKVRGKIVVCLADANIPMRMGFEVRAAGGVGMIVANSDAYWNSTTPEVHYLPATNLGYLDAMKVFSYIDNTDSPVAYIEPVMTVDGRKPNPHVAYFSSRGPNHLNLHILKPDVAAPGVNILAAYSQAAPVTLDPSDTRLSPFQVMSGTSMATPHVAGVVGLLKSIHPHWTPSAIRSAIMTTARVRDNTMKPMTDEGSSFGKATPLDLGAGFIRPNRAMDPGLVYDLSIDDYLDWTCAVGLHNLTGGFVKRECPSQPINVLDFNYPSITVPNMTNATTITVRRKVKNVGPPSSTYNATVVPPPGVSVSVHPPTLHFQKTGEEKPFHLVLKLKYRAPNDFVFGHLKWSDGVHHVRSPISVASMGKI